MSIALNRSRQVPADETPAFGGIAERFRRAGDLERAVALCRDGLKKFPDHLSARVTLGWALLDLGRYDEAQVELEQVLKRAPDNLAAIRGLAELHERAENAVVVPIDDQEAADVAAALEAGNTHAREADVVSAPAEKTPVAHEPAGKKGKAGHGAAHHVEPTPAKGNAEPDARSVFAQTIAANEPEVPPAKDRVAEPALREFAPIEPPTVAKAEPPALPSLDELAAAFEEPPAAVAVTPAAPPAPAIPEPVVVPEPVKPAKKAAAVEPARKEPAQVAKHDDAREPVKAASAPAPVEVKNVEPVKTVESAKKVEPPQRAEAARKAERVEQVEAVKVEAIKKEEPPVVPVVASPEPILEDLPELVEFLPSSTAEPIVSVDDLLLESAVEPDAPMLDLAADTTISDADTTLTDAALLAVPEIEPVAPALSEPGADLAATHAAMLAEQVSARSDAHPEPDVNELLAQLAQEPEPDVESAPAAMFTAEPAAFAHPEPDISNLVADLSHEHVEPASTAFAADAFALADAHPEPQVSERASAITTPAPIETFEHAPLTSSDAPDFLAAMEARMHVEPAIPEAVVETGPVFELSGEPPAATVFEAIAEVEIESEPLPASIAPKFDFDALPPKAPPIPAAPPVAAAPSVPVGPTHPVAASVAGARPAPVAAAPVPAPVASAAAPTPAAASMPVFVPPAMPTPPTQPAPAGKSFFSRGSKSKSKKTVAALEKMLRQVGSRKLEVASEYRSS